MDESMDALTVEESEEHPSGYGSDNGNPTTEVALFLI